MNTISYFVEGIPAPKGSLRIFTRRRPDGHIGVGATEMVTRSRPWRQAIEIATSRIASITEWEVDDSPIRMRIVFYLPKPKSVHRFWPSTKPDIDKLTRCVLDAIQDTRLIFNDDSRVIDVHAIKSYVTAGNEPGAHIEIEKIK